ncbi:hypothetical protein D3C76_1399670 [compost metagenome]
MFTFAARQRFCFNQRFRQQRRLLEVAFHLPQVRLLDVVKIFAFSASQPFTHFFIGENLMLQHAHFCQRFTARLTPVRRHHGKHIPASDGGKVRETG